MRRPAAALFPLLASAACGAHKYDYLYDTKVDCTVLPSLTSAQADDPTLSETLLAELAPGTARVSLSWDDENGNSALLTRETTAEVLLGIDGDAWSVQADLACDPAAATALHFERTADAVVPGEFPLTNFGFDVPSLEQGESGSVVNEVDGTMTVTEASERTASGFLTGSARTTLRSYITEKYLDIEVVVTGLAFRELNIE